MALVYVRKEDAQEETVFKLAMATAKLIGSSNAFRRQDVVASSD